MHMCCQDLKNAVKHLKIISGKEVPQKNGTKKNTTSISTETNYRSKLNYIVWIFL